MFNFRSTSKDGYTFSELVSDDIRYCIYTDSDGTTSEINAYIVSVGRSGLLRRDYIPLFTKFFWGGPFTTLYAGAK